MPGRWLGRWGAVRRFFDTGLWDLRIEPMPGWKAAGVRLLRILTVAVTEFMKDDCGLRASALTFYTLLSVVPILGVAFGIAKGFGLEKLLEQQLMAQMAGQEQALERILVFARNMLENAKGGLIAGVGVVLMIWAALKVLGQIEAALNTMWDIRRLRSWGRRIGDYLAVLLVAPILMLTASSANVFLRTRLDEAAARLGLLETVGPLVVHLVQLTPILLAVALFTLLYAVMPHTRVRLLPALAGGAVGGCLYHLAQWVYIGFQVGVARQNAIYGSFAALPLFLAWVQTSWLLFLFGGEIAYAVQHLDLYPYSERGPGAGRGRLQLSGLHAVWLAVRRFTRGEKPMTAPDLARATGTPLALVRVIVEKLSLAGVLAPTPQADGPAYQPAIDPGLLTLQRVWDALQESESVDPSGLPAEAARLQAALQALRRGAAESPANLPLRDI
jgi:membrane protein